MSTATGTATTSETSDLLIIGGGINGAGVARDAAGRGLGFFRGFYQGDALDNRPLFALPPGTLEAREQEFNNAGASI